MPPTPDPIASCTPSPAGLVAWWPGEGNANDVVGGNNGILEGGVSFASGEVGQAFVFDGSGSSYVRIPANPRIDVGQSDGFTIELWCDPALTNNDVVPLTLVEWNNDSGDLTGIGCHLEFYSAGRILGDIVDPNTGNDHYVESLGGNVTPNVWQHVAMTYDKTTGVLTLYQNGAVVASGNVGIWTPSTAFDLYLGIRPAGVFAPIPYQGLLDEVSLYNRALSSNEIAAIYAAGSAGKCPPPPVPVISSFIPASGTNGTVVTISGTGFSAQAAADIVYFGAVQATVSSASPTSLTVTVPAGATYAPVTVTVNGLTAYSGNPFLPTFNATGGTNSSLSLAPRLDLPAGDGSGQVVIADLDGDGKPDVLVNNGNGSASIFQNISSNGTLTAGSFAPRVDLSLGTGGENGTVAADLDGDGKLDIVLLDYNAGQVIVLKNLSTPGTLTTNSFAAPVRFQVGAGPRGLAVRDLDGDGKPEIVVANWGDSTVSVLRNISQPGGIDTNSFAPAVVFATGANPQTLAIADLDGDGQPDIVTANNNYGTDESVSILRNTSAPGTISLAAHVDLAGLPTSFCVAIGDLDGDGKPDLVVSSFIDGQAISVYRNISTPGSITTNSFAPHVDFDAGGWGNAVAIGDLDGDGKPDLAVVTQLPDHLSVFKNISTPGSFTTDSLAPRVDYPAGWNPNGVAIGDLDGDGRPDIAFAVTYAATLSVYQNQTPFNGPPVITSQPVNQTTVQGSNVVLSVIVEGTGPFSYQWSFNGKNIPGATNATLTLANLHPYQSGSYAVTITTPFGSVTSSGATVTVIAQNILIYTYSGIQKITTAGQAFSLAYSGQMFFIPDTTNGAFVGWATIKGKKQYWVNPLPEYLWATIPGVSNQTFTVLGRAGQGFDTNGYANIWTDLYKGKNTLLAIGTNTFFTFPNTFDSKATHVYPDPQTGSMVLGESSAKFTFMAQNTRNANNKGETLADLVNALTEFLAGRGYQEQ
ncbi:MAG: FG-GAP-like repeat-containing protein [Limisphaerales bacterium]